MNHFRIYPANLEWPTAADDLSAVSLEVTRLRLSTKAKSWERLREFTRLKSLWCFGVDEKALRAISNCTSLKELYLDYNLRTGDLECLHNLEQLELLTIDSCSKIDSLRQVSEFTKLEVLSIVNFKNVHNLEPLGSMTRLRELAVSGSIWTRMKIDTLQPLSSLTNLEYLDLTNNKVADESLKPIARLQKLKALNIANFYPTREFAWLAGKLRSTSCDWFKPYLDVDLFSCTKCGRNSCVLLTGKGTSRLCKHCDEQRLTNHVSEFEAIKAQAVQD